MKWNRTISFILFLLVFPIVLLGQNKYRTVDGDIVLTTVVEDSGFTLKSNSLLILLDYETAAFTLKVDKASFYTGNDTIDKRIAGAPSEILEFQGNLNLDYINTEGMLPIEFKVEGVLSVDKGNVLYGSGKLESMGEASLYTKYLSMTFLLKASDLGFDDGIDKDEPVQIEIVQALLKKQSN